MFNIERKSTILTIVAVDFFDAHTLFSKRVKETYDFEKFDIIYKIFNSPKNAT